MEKEKVTQHDYAQFLDGYALTGSMDLDLMEREDKDVPDQVQQDYKRLMFAGSVAAVAGAGIFTISNLGYMTEAWPYLFAAGAIGVTMGGFRILRRVLGKKKLNFPKLELRRKSEQVKQNAMNAFGQRIKGTKLSRSETDKVIMGVCGGLAAQTGISATLIRALWMIAFAVTSGLASIFYIALGMILPSANKQLPK
jgi:phage shock protein C